MNNPSFRRWLAVFIWIAAIYATIPFVRQLRNTLLLYIPARFIGYGVMAVIISVVIAGIAVLRRRNQRIRPSDAAWYLGVGAAFILWTGHLMAQPEEAVHFLEYGVLGFLLTRALQLRIRDTTVFVVAAVLGTMVGTVDETIQWLIPERFWDYRDIVLNGGASFLAQIALWRSAPRPMAPVRSSSLRLLSGLAACEVFLLMCCLVNTPYHVELYTSRSVVLTQLIDPRDVMTEYGHLHALDDYTKFRSRLNILQLAHQDTTRATDVAAILDASRRNYGRFLRQVSPVSEPFAYEARVHIYSRNQNFREASKLAPGSADRRKKMTAAFREHLILESYFGATISESSFIWTPQLRAQVAEEQNPESLFVSKVGRHLITVISEGHLRAIMLALLVVLLMCSIFLGRFTRPILQPQEEPPA